MSEQSWIWVTFKKAGTHCYPEAAVNKELADVSFLGFPHRHLFCFKVYLEVFHDNRDVEFLQFKKWLESLYEDGELQANSKSCEMLARELAEKIQQKYQRSTKVEVSEDGENGCEMLFPFIPLPTK